MDNNFTDHELSVAAWLLYHKNGVRRASLAIIIGIITLTWGYFFFTLIDATLLHYRSRARATAFLTAHTVPLAALRASSVPQDIVVGSPERVGSGTTSGTLTTIQNPNTDWVARVAYAAPITKKQVTTSIAPGDTAYVFSPDDEGPALQQNAITWQRVNRADVGDIEAFKAARRNFTIKDAKYTADLATDQKSTVYHISFTATNATSWSYWQVPMLVLLYQGDRIAAAATTMLDNFKTGDTRTADIVLPQPIGGVSRIEVIPQLDLFDPGSYMPLPQAPKPEIGS